MTTDATAPHRSPDRLRVAALTVDRSGACLDANDLAREFAASRGIDLIPGRTVDAALLTNASVLPDGDGTTVHLLRSDDAADRAAAHRFALESADALAGMLNLRRTLRRVVDLTRTGFPGHVGLDLLADRSVRRLAAEPGGTVKDETVRRRTLDADTEQWLVAAVQRPPRQELVDDADGTPAVLTTVPVGSSGGERGVLWVRTAPESCPVLDDVVALARRASIAVSSARVYEERSELAGRLRAALLPAALPAVPGVELGAAYRPAAETTQIGGDFYDVAARGDGAWTLTVGDVCGKGVDAAVLTGRVRQSVRTATLVTDDPRRVLELVNDTLRTDDGSTFVTLVHAVITPTEGGVHVRLAAGGHPEPLLLHAGRVETVAARGTIVGMLPDVHFDPVELDLVPGDLLLLYTDGAPEARGAGGLLDIGPVVDTLADCDGMTAQSVAERLMQLVLEHLDGRPHDDVAFVAVRAEPAP